MVLGQGLPGDVLGLEEVLSGMAYQQRVRALVRCMVRRVPAETWVRILRQGGSPALALGSLVARAGCLARRRRYAELGYGTVEARTSRVLLNLMQRVGTPEGAAVRIPVPLSRVDLACVLGCRVETLSRILKDLAAAGVVMQDRQGFLVQDPQALQARASVAADAAPRRAHPR